MGKPLTRVHLALLAALPLIFTGCSASGSADGQQSTTLTAAWLAVPENVDPEVFEGTKSQQFAAAVGETLFEWDMSDDPNQIPDISDIRGDLVSKYEVLDGGKRIRMHLHEGVKSSAGNILTADDVAWSFDRWIDSNAVLGAILFPLASVDKENPVKVVDKFTFDYNLTAPSSLALPILTWPGASILDSTEAKKHVTAKDPFASKWLASNTATFGPYTLSNFDAGKELVLKANKNYWRKEPYFTTVVLRAIPDSASRVQLLVSGTVDYIQDIPFGEAESLRHRDDVNLLLSASVNRGTLDFDVTDDRFADPMVRRAISLAIDRQGIADSLLHGVGKPATSCASSGLSIPPPADPLPPSGDIDEAKATLARSAYPKGFAFDLYVNASRPGPYSPDMARLIKSDLAKIGVTANIKVIQSQATFQEGINDGRYASWIYSDGPVVPDVGYDWYQKLYSTSFVNNANYDNQVFDDRLDELLKTPVGDPRREQLISQICDSLIEDAPMLWLVELTDVRAVASGITGFKPYPHAGARFSEFRPG